MESERSLSVTVSDDLADMVREKVAAGEYASEDEVVRAGLALLAMRDGAVEDWRRTRSGPAYDRARAAPQDGGSAAEMRRAHRLAPVPW